LSYARAHAMTKIIIGNGRAALAELLIGTMAEQ